MFMKRTLGLLAAAALLLAGAVTTQAQEKMAPPKILVITREVEKLGKGAAHEKLESTWAAAFKKAHAAPYLAVSAMTGEHRALFMSGYDSIAAWEKDNKAQEANATFQAENESLAAKDADLISESTTGVYTYMPEISYQLTESVATSRYFVISAIDVKPGHGDHFVEIRKLIKAAHEKAGLSDHYAVYHRSFGGPSTRYLIFVPVKSLAELDQFNTVHGKAYHDALGEGGQKKIDEFNMQGLASTEANVFSFSSKMSNTSKDWIDADPGFWAPKPAAAAKPKAAKKEAAPKP
jgi:hypothetical protein